MKIGLYLAYAPFSPNASLKKEGLGRYIALLVQYFTRAGHTVILACPNWAKDTLGELLSDYSINLEHLELVTTKSAPILLSLYYRFLKRKTKNKSKLRWKISSFSNSCLEWLLNVFLSVKNVVAFIFIIILGLSIGVFLVPLAVIVAAALGIVKTVISILNRIFKFNLDFSIKGIIRKALSLPGLSWLNCKARSVIAKTDIRESLRANAAKELLQRIRMLRRPPDLWYSPTAFWPEFATIQGVAITCIPDIVMDEFSVDYAKQDGSVDSFDALNKTVNSSHYFITYCDYIKKSVLIDKWGITSDKIVPIMMFNNEMNSYINVQSSYPYQENANYFFARQILDDARIFLYYGLHNFMQSDRWLSFKDIKYIFYASQMRPHKNVLNLVKAYNHLLRREKISCKLFLTGEYHREPLLNQYIKEQQLQNEIFCFVNVPSQTLAALYACAELCVNPTLYEGGFPFTLSEGMSVGTPSIMSRIPQVTEFTDGWGIDDCLFDPYDYKDIADKILFGLNNRKALVERQMPLYQAHSKRTTSGQAGQEYIEAFQYFIELDKTVEKKHAKKK